MRARIVVLGCALVLTACGGGATGRTTVVVSAAASLTDAFEAIADDFERAHPDVDVVLNVAGSATLRTQILEGAPVDVFASANLAVMQAVEAAGALQHPPVTFTTNTLTIAVPAGNPASVGGLADLADPGLLVGVCAAGVPCGDLARLVFSRAGVSLAADTEEPDVRALLTKIDAEELDAGLTYTTDVEANEGVDGIAIDPELNVVAEYPIAALAEAPNPALAAAFVDAVLSPAGQRILRDHGFRAP